MSAAFVQEQGACPDVLPGCRLQGCGQGLGVNPLLLASCSTLGRPLVAHADLACKRILPIRHTNNWTGRQLTSTATDTQRVSCHAHDAQESMDNRLTWHPWHDPHMPNMANTTHLASMLL